MVLSCRGALWGGVSNNASGRFLDHLVIIIIYTQIDLLDHQEKIGFRVYIRSLIYISLNHLWVPGLTLIFRSFGVNNILD